MSFKISSFKQFRAREILPETDHSFGDKPEGSPDERSPRTTPWVFRVTFAVLFVFGVYVACGSNLRKIRTWVKLLVACGLVLAGMFFLILDVLDNSFALFFLILTRQHYINQMLLLLGSISDLLLAITLPLDGSRFLRNFDKIMANYLHKYKQPRISLACRVVFAVAMTAFATFVIFSESQAVLLKLTSHRLANTTRTTGHAVPVFGEAWGVLKTLLVTYFKLNQMAIFSAFVVFSIFLRHESKRLTAEMREFAATSLSADSDLLEAFRVRHGDLCSLITSLNGYMRHFMACAYIGGMVTILIVVYGFSNSALQINFSSYTVIDMVKSYAGLSIFITGIGILLNREHDLQIQDTTLYTTSPRRLTIDAKDFDDVTRQHNITVFLYIPTSVLVAIMHKTEEILYDLDYGKMTTKSFEIVSLFLSRLQRKSIGFNIYGLITIDSSVIPGVLKLLMLYFIIITNLQPAAITTNASAADKVPNNTNTSTNISTTMWTT